MWFIECNGLPAINNGAVLTEARGWGVQPYNDQRVRQFWGATSKEPYPVATNSQETGLKLC